jgi:hypothetical protein
MGLGWSSRGHSSTGLHLGMLHLRPGADGGRDRGPYILLHNGQITRHGRPPPCSVGRPVAKPMLIVAGDVDGEALSTLVITDRGLLNVVAVKGQGSATGAGRCWRTWRSRPAASGRR